MNRSYAKRGFTLTEVLVVIAIIGILLAILIPVFMKVRERGRAATCASNLRQLALGMHQYLADNNGEFPVIFYVTDDGSDNPGVSVFTWDDAIFPYVKNAQVYRCPDYPIEPYVLGVTSNESYTPPAPNVTYDFDFARLQAPRPPHSPGKAKGILESQLSDQSAVWLNSDDVQNEYDLVLDKNPPYQVSITASCGFSLSASTVHSGGGNYSFVDGHVKWLSPAAYGEQECAAGPPSSPFSFK